MVNKSSISTENTDNTNKEVFFYQTDQIHVTGIQTRFFQEETLKSEGFFGQYGEIERIFCWRKIQEKNGEKKVKKETYIKYKDSFSAALALYATNDFFFQGKNLRVQYAKTWLCPWIQCYWKCENSFCNFYHENKRDRVVPLLHPNVISLLQNNKKMRTFLELKFERKITSFPGLKQVQLKLSNYLSKKQKLEQLLSKTQKFQLKENKEIQSEKSMTKIEQNFIDFHFQSFDLLNSERKRKVQFKMAIQQKIERMIKINNQSKMSFMKDVREQRRSVFWCTLQETVKNAW